MAIKKINIGVIGCGYWGPNHIRIFSYLQQSNVIMACDIDNKNLNRIRTKKNSNYNESSLGDQTDLRNF